MVMYGPTAFLTKISLLWIMTRVFSPYRKAVFFIYIFLVIMLLYYIPAVIVKIRICNPIGKFWDDSINGSCLDQSAIILADAVVSVVSDAIILILPLPLTLSLQMSMRKKVRVMGILGAGGLACASSVVRLILILKTGQSKDGTYSFMRINMFGCVFYPLSASFPDSTSSNKNLLSQKRRNRHRSHLRLPPLPLRSAQSSPPRILQQQQSNLSLHPRTRRGVEAEPHGSETQPQQTSDEPLGYRVRSGDPHAQCAGGPEDRDVDPGGYVVAADCAVGVYGYHEDGGCVDVGDDALGVCRQKLRQFYV